MNETFTRFDTAVEKFASMRKPTIAFGMQEPDREILESLERSKKYADIILVGPEAIQNISGFTVVVDSAPEEKIAHMLVSGEISGFVRGTIDDFKTNEAYLKLSGASGEEDLPSILQDPTGRIFMLSPLSNPQGWSKEERLHIAKGLAAFAATWGIPVKIAVYTGVRHETFKRKGDITEGVAGILNQTYRDAEWIVEELMKDGVDAKNWSIDFDLAARDGYTIHVPVNGMVGNQMFRVLLLCGGKILIGTRSMSPHIREDNSRNEKDFDFHVKWLAALINKKASEGRL